MPPETPFTRSTFEGIFPLNIFVRGPNDSFAEALEAFGATRVSSLEFRMLDSARALETRLESSPFKVRETPDRLATTGQRHRRIGVRLGPAASGEGATSMQTPPPGLRRGELARFRARFLSLGQ